MIKQTLIGAAIIALAINLTGCGSSTKTTVQNTETQGQQLMDLKEAYDKGVISEKEYKRAKKEILDQ
ncbi:MAG: hypothetical protein Hals2KO_13260 [Halioglobus sp.]